LRPLNQLDGHLVFVATTKAAGNICGIESFADQNVSQSAGKWLGHGIPSDGEARLH